MIQFNETPATMYKPRKTAEIDRTLAARNLLASNRHRLCLIGQMTSSGSASTNAINRVFTAEEAAALFGPGSELHLMVMAAFKANPDIETICVAADEAAGADPATATVTFTNDATADGYGLAWIGGRKFTWDIDSGDTVTEIAAAMAAAVTGESSLPVTAAAASGVVTLTAKCTGPMGNEIPLSVTVSSGTTTAAATTFSTGALDPDIASALSAVESPGDEYQPDLIVVSANSQAALTELRTHLNTVAGVKTLKYAHGFAGFTGTLSAATTLAGQINNWWVQLAHLKGSKSLAYEIGAAYAAVVGFEEDPARPLQTLPLTGIDPPAPEDRWLDSEHEVLLDNGVGSLEVGPGEVVQIVRVVTTYRLNAESARDISGFDYNIPATLAYIAQDLVDAERREFPREKLTARTENAVRSLILNRMRLWEEAELIENVDDYVEALKVERNDEDPARLDTELFTDVVWGLRIIANKISQI